MWVVSVNMFDVRGICGYTVMYDYAIGQLHEFIPFLFRLFVGSWLM